MYTADKFNRDMHRLIIAANIGYIWYSFKDAHGSSGTMVVFGTSKTSASYFVEEINEDRYNVYYMRTITEMIKEIRKDFPKFKEIYPDLALVTHPDLLSEKKYDRVVNKDLSYYLRRKIKYFLAFGEFKNFMKGAILFFKKQETLNKKKLFDLLVTKGKLDMDYFEKSYGSMGDEGEDISERVKHYKHGNWDIYLDIKTKRGIDEVIQLLDDANKDLTRRGYSKLCYGKVFMMDNLGGRKLADYDPKNDSMRIGFKMLKKSNAQNQKISLIHELGHRNKDKFLTSKQREEISNKYFSEAKLSTPKNKPHSGEVVTSKTYGDRYKVERLDYKRTLKYVVQLIELGENTKTKPKNLNQRFLIDDKYIGIEYIPEGREGSENTFVPRAYGLINEDEFYAVLWETWFQDKLRDPAKTWFENLEK